MRHARRRHFTAPRRVAVRSFPLVKRITVRRMHGDFLHFAYCANANGATATVRETIGRQALLAIAVPLMPHARSPRSFRRLPLKKIKNGFAEQIANYTPIIDGKGS